MRETEHLGGLPINNWDQLTRLLTLLSLCWNFELISRWLSPQLSERE